MFKTVSFAAVLLVTLPLTSIAQPKGSGPLGTPGTAAFNYFDQIRGLNFGTYLKRIRPAQLSPESKARFIAILPRQDIVTPTREGLNKLAALQPVLEYYGRKTVTDLKVVRMGEAAILFLAGAAIVISEEALGLLTAKELQAIVAHEMGHEYFWDEWQLSRMNKQYEKIQEIELRCDGLAVITLNQLGLDPSNLIAATTKLAKAHNGPVLNAEYYPSLEERIKFTRTMIEMVKARADVFGPIASNNE